MKKTLNQLIQQIFGDYDIYKRICELASNTFVVPDERQFEEHERLLADATTNFVTKFLRSKRVRKIGVGFGCDLYITLRVCKPFQKVKNVSVSIVLLNLAASKMNLPGVNVRCFAYHL